MTATAVDSLHELPELVVGDLVLAVAPPSDRTTIAITVERDATLILKAPHDTTIERATQFVVDKHQWVYRKLAEKDALTGPPITKQFVEGEGFAYLGRSYRLTLSEKVADVRLERGRFHMNPSQAGEGAAAMRRWYTTTGAQWLAKRIRPWTARMGEDTIDVAVRDLGYRWGSARPSEGFQSINIHWAALQLHPASSTTSSSTNSPTSTKPTTPPNSGPSSPASCPPTRLTKRFWPPSARTSGSGQFSKPQTSNQYDHSKARPTVPYHPFVEPPVDS